MNFPTGAQAPVTTSKAACKGPGLSQACMHYASVISVNPKLGAMTCADFLGKRSPGNGDKRPIVDQWNTEHKSGWLDAKYRNGPYMDQCDRDEWPGRYFYSSDNDPKLRSLEQRVRYVPWKMNQDAGQLWRSFCWKQGVSFDKNDYSVVGQPQVSTSTQNYKNAQRNPPRSKFDPA